MFPLTTANRSVALANWRNICDDIPDNWSLEERMQQLGTLLGEEGRDFVLSRLDDDKDAFRDDIRNFANEFLLVQNPQAKRAVEVSTDEEPSSKRTKPQEPSFTERCLKWYRRQPGVLKGNPPKVMMELFNSTIEEARKIPAFMLKNGAFKSEALAKSFVKFLQSSEADVKPTEPKVLEATKKAFLAEYKDDNNVVDDFIGYVDECHHEYKTNVTSYSAPYISLCQSSGYGKSRLLQQVSRKRKLLYVSVGDSTQSFPRPNQKARSFLFADRRETEEDRQEHLQQQLERCVSWCLQNDFKTTDQFGEHPAAFWADIVALNKANTDSKRKHDDADIDSKSNTDDEVIMIAFDEARSLLNESDDRLSDFRVLRRALRVVSSLVHHRIFVILADTKSTIANFSPSKGLDASYRPEEEGMHLFHPYILLLTHDALNNGDQADFESDWSFLNCGRPLWKSLFPKPSESSLGLLTYASQKLCKALELNLNDELALLAITMCRTGMYVSPQSSVASNLAANYMATILLSDCAHEHFLVTYLSDPVLTIAGAKMWYKNDLLVTHALPVLRQKMIHGAVLEGYLGELVGRVLLLIGMDKTSIKGYYDGTWCKVSEFMKHCFGVHDCMVSQDAFVGFSHFIPCAEAPKSYQDLERLLYRRGACCLPAGHKGADLLIPFFVRQKNKESLISYILIQIKNRKGRVKDISLFEKLEPEACFPKESELQTPVTDIISIIMQTGLMYQRPKKTISHKDTRKNPPVDSPTTRSRSKPIAGDPLENSPPDNAPVSHRKNWRYCANGIYHQVYPFLQGQEKLENELRRLGKGSLNLNEWMKFDEKLNTPESSPGMARRKEHILSIGLATRDEK